MIPQPVPVKGRFRAAVQLPAYFLQSSGYVTVPDPFQHPGNLLRAFSLQITETEGHCAARN